MKNTKQLIKEIKRQQSILVKCHVQINNGLKELRDSVNSLLQSLWKKHIGDSVKLEDLRTMAFTCGSHTDDWDCGPTGLNMTTPDEKFGICCTDQWYTYDFVGKEEEDIDPYDHIYTIEIKIAEVNVPIKNTESFLVDVKEQTGIEFYFFYPSQVAGALYDFHNHQETKEASDVQQETKEASDVQ